MAAAKSLINYFRDVCPQMLPKKHVGRFTDLEETKTPMVFGQTKLAFNIDGIELLKEGEGVATERMLSNEDLRKIKYRQLKKAVQKVDRKKFRDSSDDESAGNSGDEEEGELEGMDSEEMEQMESEMSEEGRESDMEGMESEMEEEGEAEMLEQKEDRVEEDSYNSEDWRSESEMNSSDMGSSDESIPDSDEQVDEMENPHGFIYSHQLDTYKRSKKERL